MMTDATPPGPAAQNSASAAQNTCSESGRVQNETFRNIRRIIAAMPVNAAARRPGQTRRSDPKINARLAIPASAPSHLDTLMDGPSAASAHAWTMKAIGP